MKSHKLLFVFSIFAMLFLFGLTGCPTDDKELQLEVPPPDGRATKTANGFASTPAPEYIIDHGTATPGRPVTVTVETKDGKIFDVVISGPDESTGNDRGQAVIAVAPAKIKAQNSFDIDLKIDAYTRATYTIDAIKKAGKAAIAQIIADNQ